MPRNDTWSNDEAGAARAAQDFATDPFDGYDPNDDRPMYDDDPDDYNRRPL
jgi:hypothetical protein